MQAQKIPFSGRAAERYSVMGVLEARDLDSKKYCLWHEGNLRFYVKTRLVHSTIGSRKAYGIPTLIIVMPFIPTSFIVVPTLIQFESVLQFRDRCIGQWQNEPPAPAVGSWIWIGIKHQVLANRIQLKAAAPSHSKQSESHLHVYKAIQCLMAKNSESINIEWLYRVRFALFETHYWFQGSRWSGKNLMPVWWALLLHDVLHQFYLNIKEKGRSGILPADFKILNR